MTDFTQVRDHTSRAIGIFGGVRETPVRLISLSASKGELIFHQSLHCRFHHFHPVLSPNRIVSWSVILAA